MKSIIKSLKIVASILIIMSATYCFAQGQGDSLTYRIETVDGNIYSGQIIASDSVNITLYEDQLGQINILRSQIKEMYPIDPKKIKEGKYWFDNPQATRYFYAPNGYALQAGEGYYQNVWVLFNSFAVGITDHFSLGAGVVPLFLFAGAPTPVWVTPKFSIPISKDEISIGAGALAGAIVGEEKSGFGILYGLSTFGSKDKNISLGLGYGYAGGDWANTPMINLSAMIRTGAQGYFLTENYFIRSGGTTTAIIWLGGRQIIRDAGLDYGLMIPIYSEMEDFIAIPWLGITIPFGNQHIRAERQKGNHVSPAN